MSQDDWLPPPSSHHGEGMLEWAKENGLTVSQKVDFFAPSTPPSQGFCAIAKERIEPGELLCGSPKR
eukprot:symbB.v1.2.022946.t1/scaffold2067.1/size90749/6